MLKNIEPKLRKIGDYLKLEKETMFIIPEYQRPYSWEIANCDKLWQDIIDFSQNQSGDPYFFGTIIISCDDNKKTYELIDGQQRTTTFFLLLKALLIGVNTAIEKINKNDEDSNKSFQNLRDRRKEIISILYGVDTDDICDAPNMKEDSIIYEKFNSLLNISNNENDKYKDELNIILKSICFEDAEKNTYQIPYKKKDNRKTNFFKNFKYFYNKICDLGESQINSIAKSILKNCEIIEIKSWNVEQAITMFNSLNSDGMPLSDADIISSKLFAFSKFLNKENEYCELWKNLLYQLSDSKITGVITLNSILNQYMYLNRAKNNEMTADTTVPGVRRYFIYENENLIKKQPIAMCANLCDLTKIWSIIYEYPIIKVLLKCNENAKLFLGCYFNRYLNNVETINEEQITLLAEAMLKLFIILELVDAGFSSRNFKTFLFKEAIKLSDKNTSIKEITQEFNSHIKENWEAGQIESLICDYDKNLLVFINEYLFAKENNLILDLNSKCDVEHIMPASGHNLDSIRKDAHIKDENEFNEIANKLGNKILLEEKINRNIQNDWFRTKLLRYTESKYPIASSLVKRYKNISNPYWNKNDISDATIKIAKRITKFIFD